MTIKTDCLNDRLAAIMAGVQRLSKSEENKHANYRFAGIDAFLDLTRPLCAEHGVTVRQDEEAFEIVEVPGKQGVQKMLLMRFAFTLVYGAECDGPYRRSIMVPANMGSQAFGAAQSYALKQFLRALFQISTGDKGEDIDEHDTGELGTYAPMPDAEFAKMVQLIEATHANTGAMIKHFGVANLRQLNQAQYAEAIDMLNAKLAKLAKAESNAKGSELADAIDDAIVF